MAEQPRAPIESVAEQAGRAMVALTLIEEWFRVNEPDAGVDVEGEHIHLLSEIEDVQATWQSSLAQEIFAVVLNRFADDSDG